MGGYNLYEPSRGVILDLRFRETLSREEAEDTRISVLLRPFYATRAVNTEPVTATVISHRFPVSFDYDDGIELIYGLSGLTPS